MKCSLIAVLAVSVVTCSRPTGSGQWLEGEPIDLSHEYSDQTVFWPTAEAFKLDTVADGVTPQGYYYAANNFSTSEHGGTHIDAPLHFAKGHRSVDQIPLDQLIGPTVVVDVTTACAHEPDYRVTIEDFTGWERSNGEIPAGAIVFTNLIARPGRSQLYFVLSTTTRPAFMTQRTLSRFDTAVMLASGSP